MEKLYNLLISITTFVAGIIIFCAPFSIPKASSKQRMIYGLIVVIFSAVVFVAYYLKKKEHIGAANILLGILWCLIIGAIIYAIMNVRWN